MKKLEDNSALNGTEGIIIGRDELHDVFKVRLLSIDKVMGVSYGNLTTLGVRQDVFRKIPLSDGVRVRVNVKMSDFWNEKNQNDVANYKKWMVGEGLKDVLDYDGCEGAVIQKAGGLEDVLDEFDSDVSTIPDAAGDKDATVGGAFADALNAGEFRKESREERVARRE